MTDVLTPAQRHNCMSRIRGKDTKPEMVVRKYLHGRGFRYRLHRRDLPGTPDIVFPSRKRVILVHGCFWHAHRCREGRNLPKTNIDFWVTKRKANQLRDRLALRRLRSSGWVALTIWECETKDIQKVINRIVEFLST